MNIVVERFNDLNAREVLHSRSHLGKRLRRIAGGSKSIKDALLTPNVSVDVVRVVRTGTLSARLRAAWEKHRPNDMTFMVMMLLAGGSLIIP